MSNFFKRVISFCFISLSFILISFIWNDISLPLKNTNQTVGFLPIQNYNPFNDTIRYLCIIIIPLFLYVLFKIYIQKKKIKLNNLLGKTSNNLDGKLIHFSEIKYFFIGFLFLIIVQFLSFDHAHDKLDYLHDGDYLMPAYNFISDEGFWSTAFSSHGGADIFYAMLSWKIFKTTSIGSVKVFMSFFVILLKIVSVFFIFKLINLSFLNIRFKKFLFIILSIIIINLSNFEFPMNYSIISYRDMYYLLFFIFLIDFIYYRSVLSIYLIPFITFLTPLLHIDTGIYLNTLFIFLMIYLFLIKEFKNLTKILCVYIICWFSLFVFIGQYEFSSFLNHLIYMAQHVDLVHGLRHPQPIFEINDSKHGFRATKGLIFQLVACLIILREILFRDNRTNKDKILLIFLIFMSFIAYKNALGRSDAQHIRMSSDLPLIIISFFTIEFFLNFFQKKNLKFNYLKYLNFSIFALIIFLFLNIFNFNNLKNNRFFLSSIKNDDYKFLDEDSKKFINKSAIYFKDEKCIFNFTTDISLPYFMKKKTCNKYFSPWLISGIKLEKEYIDDLKKIDHNFILYSSPKFSPDNITTKERLKIVNKYLIKNYNKVYSEDGFEILEKLN